MIVGAARTAKGGGRPVSPVAARDRPAGVIEQARRTAARSVNAVMTATYWLVGRRIYRTSLPDERVLVEMIERTRRRLEETRSSA